MWNPYRTLATTLTPVYEFEVNATPSVETILDEHRITLTCQPPFPPAIEEAARLLQSGSLAILPTDTVYGVCASIRDDEAVRGIYAAKGKGPRRRSSSCSRT